MFAFAPFRTISNPNNKSAPVIAMRNGRSTFFEDVLIGIGENRDIKPITKSILNKFEPTMFPTDMSMLFEIALVILTESSGRLVPRATMVRPINKLGTLHLFAMALAPLTKKSAPLIKKAIPKIKNKTFKKIVIIIIPS